MVRTYDLLENILVDVEKGIRDDITVNTLADKYTLSERHLRRLFKFAFKQSLAEYIRSRKLAESLKDLLATDTNLVDIALDFGFGYEQTYIRAFKREFGMTPGYFRKAGYVDKTKLLLCPFDKNNVTGALFKDHFLEMVL